MKELYSLDAAVDLLESQFIEQYGGGLFIDNPQRPILASKWAALMDSQFNTRQYSQWLKDEPYLTGRYFGLHVILFLKLDADELPTGLTAYQLTGRGFGESDREGARGYFKTDPLSIELDAKGHLITGVKPLPLGGTDNPTPEQEAQYRKEWKELRRYKDAHHGRSPEEEAAHQEKRKQWRQKDYLKNKKRGNDNNDKRQ